MRSRVAIPRLNRLEIPGVDFSARAQKVVFRFGPINPIGFHFLKSGSRYGGRDCSAAGW